MDAAGSHPLDARVSRFVHENESAATEHSAVVLGAIALRVEVADGHEVLVANQSGFEERCAPKEAALGVAADGLKRLHAIDHTRRIERLECGLISENAREVDECAGAFDE